MKKAIMLALLLIAPAYANEPKTITIGMTEADLIKIKGTPFSSARGPKKSLLQWDDFNAWTEDGKVISFYEKKAEVVVPVGQAEIDIMARLHSLREKVNAVDGISNEDYLNLTKEALEFFRDHQEDIKNKQFKEVCTQYLTAIQLFRTMLSLEWEKNLTKESYYYVRKDRNPEIYKLIIEIPPAHRAKTIKSDLYQDAFEVYDSGVVYTHIDSRYWLRLGKIFVDNLDKTKPSPEPSGEDTPN
jgi:hypothetical protein